MKPDWTVLENRLNQCEACRLCETRTHVVPGEGNRQADLLFIGEGPGGQEDLQGRPFVGPAGKLLDRMLAAIHLSREEVYLANVVKCRPPGNRNPADSEAEACLPYLRWQVALIHPKLIVCLGTVACRHIIAPDAKVSRCRGQFIQRGAYEIFATYHPAALLRDERLKLEAWKDFQAIRDKLASLQEEGSHGRP